MKDNGFKRVDRTLIVGPRGLPVVSSGYTEIGGVRLYDDELIIGRYGLPEVRQGRVEIVERKI